jgi:hypothetical protein
MRKYPPHFPRTVPSIDDLPEPVRLVLQQHQLDTHVRQIVFVPTNTYPLLREEGHRLLPFLWRHTPDRTLVLSRDHIAVVTVGQDGLTLTVIPLAAVVGVYLVTVLLYAYVELAWIAAGQVEVLKIEFNLVGLHLIRRVVDQARSSITAHGWDVRAGTADPIAPLPLKFRNYLRDGLLPDERVLAAIYQPPIRRSGRWLRPLLCPDHVVALTDRHVILIEAGRQQIDERYAMNTRFCPLRSLQRVTFDAVPDAVEMRLRLGMNGTGHEVGVLLQDPQAAAVHQAFADCYSDRVPVQMRTIKHSGEQSR